MTALIKSTDGSGWVEARVDMIVRHPVISESPLKIAMVKDTVYGPWVSVIDNESVEYDVKPSDCTLIHCPFRDGDDVIIGIMHPFEDEIHWYDRYRYGDPSLHPLNKNERSCDFIIHSSPLLRPVGGV